MSVLHEFIRVSRSEPHTNVVSDAPYDLTTCDHMIIRPTGMFHGLAPYVQSSSLMV